MEKIYGRLDEFLFFFLSRTLSLGGGLVGQVWELGKITWVGQYSLCIVYGFNGREVSVNCPFPFCQAGALSVLVFFFL